MTEIQGAKSHFALKRHKRSRHRAWEYWLHRTFVRGDARFSRLKALSGLLIVCFSLARAPRTLEHGLQPDSPRFILFHEMELVMPQVQIYRRGYFAVLYSVSIAL